MKAIPKGLEGWLPGKKDLGPLIAILSFSCGHTLDLYDPEHMLTPEKIRETREKCKSGPCPACWLTIGVSP